jgi:tetratricopeptide (TPR) repeat protein
MCRVLCLIVCQIFVLAWNTVADQKTPAVPELPTPALENVSPRVRDQIREAYSDARAHLADANSSGRLGMIFQAYGLWHEAALSYRRAIRLAPSNFKWIYYLGTVEASQGHCSEAAASFRSALHLDPNYLPAQLGLANCQLTSADWNGSEELYGAIVRNHSDNADAYYGLGRVRASRRDFPGAADAYGKACALFPDFGAAHYALALVYRTLGQDDKAEEQLRLFETNKDAAPPSNDSLLNEVRALNLSASSQVQAGIDLERQGRLEESVMAHEKALQIDPQMVQAHINLIELYSRTGQFDKAEEHYRAAVRVQPYSVEGYYNYGVLLLTTQRFEAAESAFRKTIEINPFHASAHNNMGYLLERRGRLVEAAAEYRKAIDNKPSDRQAHFNLGRVLVNQHDYNGGIQELKKTIEPEDGDTPRYIYALGAAFARSGDRQNALHYIRRARDGAVARGQSGLVDSIERDLRILETPPVTPR